MISVSSTTAQEGAGQYCGYIPHPLPIRARCVRDNPTEAAPFQPDAREPSALANGNARRPIVPWGRKPNGPTITTFMAANHHDRYTKKTPGSSSWPRILRSPTAACSSPTPGNPYDSASLLICSLQPVDFPELVAQVAEVWLGCQAAPGNAIKQFHRLELGTVPVYVLPQPTRRSRTRLARSCSPGPGCPVRSWPTAARYQVSQSISWKIADQTSRPMHVLQHPWHRQEESALGILGTWRSRLLERRHRDRAFHQRDFQLETQHDVQVVSGLVSLDPNQGSLDFVDRPVEGLQIHVAQLTGERFCNRG